MATEQQAKERAEKALKLFNSLQSIMVYLYGRWQDEKEYEDIKDYGVNIKKEVEAVGGEFIKMNKKPFGFTFKLADATYQIKVTSKSYEYNRIA